MKDKIKGKKNQEKEKCNSKMRVSFWSRKSIGEVGVWVGRYKDVINECVRAV